VTRVVEPVGKPLKGLILALKSSDVISLVIIRIVMAMILGPNDGLPLARLSSRDIAVV